MTSRARSCGNNPSGPASTKERSRSQSNASRTSAASSAARSKGSVVTLARAQATSACRCSRSGTVPRNRRTRVATRSGESTARSVSAVPDDLIGQQRQAERMAVAGFQQTPVHGLGHAAAAKVIPSFLRRQVAQGDDPEQFPPRRIGAPARSGRLSAGEHRHHVGGEFRQQLLPDPVVQSREPFVGVEQHDRVAPDRHARRPVGHAARWRAPYVRLPGEGRRSRPSSRTTRRCFRRAAAAKASSRLDFPIPPGPCTKSTANAGDSPSRQARKSSISAARPTKRCRRRETNTSPSVGDRRVSGTISTLLGRALRR